MAHDALRVLQSSVTKTADFNSSAVDLKTGTRLDETLFARILADYTHTSGYWIFHIEGSSDNSNWYKIASHGLNGVSDRLTATGTKTIWIPIVTKLRYIRLVLDATTGSGSGSVVYQAHLTLAAR